MNERLTPTTGKNTHAAEARAKLGEAGGHLKHAASTAGTTARNAARHAAEAAGEDIREGNAAIRDDLTSARQAGRAAATEARAAAGDTWNGAVSRGRDFLGSAEALIRERPLTAFGVAFAAGFLLSRISHR